MHAAGDLSEEGGQQRQFGMECMVCYSTHDRVILVLEGAKCHNRCGRDPYESEQVKHLILNVMVAMRGCYSVEAR